MKTIRIYYSIDVQCESKDVINFVRIKHPGIDYNYEYVEEIKELKVDIFGAIAECLNPNK